MNIEYKKKVIEEVADGIMSTFIKAGYPFDLMCSIGMSIVGSVIVSVEGEDKEQAVLALVKMAFMLRHHKPGDALGFIH